MENKREEEKEIKSKEPKKARYITKLMETAERRKLENELRVERQVQKEREAEGEEFKDKESFVTTAYRKKLEEMRLLEEQNKRDDYLEAIGDVTKQNDLDGFYRHLYEQKMGTSKEVKKPELQTDAEETISYKPIKSGKVPPQRAYRKRQSSVEEEEEDNAVKDKSLNEEPEKKIHLTNNIDADSDFSIDGSSSDSDTDDDKPKTSSKKPKLHKDSAESTKDSTEDSKILETPGNTIALNLKSLKPEEETGTAVAKESATEDVKLPIPSVDVEEKTPPKPKRDKAEIWGKRTVGDVYIAAVQRYYERKATRNQA